MKRGSVTAIMSMHKEPKCSYHMSFKPNGTGYIPTTSPEAAETVEEDK